MMTKRIPPSSYLSRLLKRTSRQQEDNIGNPSETLQGDASNVVGFGFSSDDGRNSGASGKAVDPLRSQAEQPEKQEEHKRASPQQFFYRYCFWYTRKRRNILFSLWCLIGLPLLLYFVFSTEFISDNMQSARARFWSSTPQISEFARLRNNAKLP